MENTVALLEKLKRSIFFKGTRKKIRKKFLLRGQNRPPSLLVRAKSLFPRACLPGTEPPNETNSRGEADG